MINGKTVYNERLFMAGLWSVSDLFDRNDSVTPFRVWVVRGAHLTTTNSSQKIRFLQKDNVFDMEGNKIPDGATIMGGKELKETVTSRQAIIEEEYLRSTGMAMEEYIRLLVLGTL